MTFLGQYLSDKSIKKAEFSRKNKPRKLSTKDNINLKAEELYLNSKSIDKYTNGIIKRIIGHLKLNK